MNDNLTMSTFQIFGMFPNAESARLYLEGRLWPQGAVCPACEKGDRVKARKGGFYRCNRCLEDFTVRTGTIFERSHVPLNKWLYAMYLLLTSRKGISSLQLSKEIGITQKSAWFLLQRIREACGNDLAALRGIVEIDEAYIGGSETNKHANKKLHMGRGPKGKAIALGMKERDGRVFAKSITTSDTYTLKFEVEKRVAPGSKVFTDEHTGYETIEGFDHQTIKHGKKEYVRGEVNTNSIESVWAVLKRGLNGVYHHASKKHLDRYLNEFTFRLNEGNVKVPTMDRIDSLVRATKGKRITYRHLIFSEA